MIKDVVATFLDETDAALGVAFRGPNGKDMFLTADGTMTYDIFNSRDYQDEDAILTVKELRKAGVDANVSVWFNAVDGYLIAHNMTLADLQKDTKQFKLEQSKYDKNWIDWFEDPTK